MTKHTYSVTINRIPASREPIEYKFRSTACTLTCAKDAAAVRFQMGTKKTFEDLISFRVDLVKDAMRKMYLLHAMRFDSRLRVRSVTVTIDGESKVYAQGYPGFPFLYSMLTAKSLGLPERWRDMDFLTDVLTRPKSKTDNDHRYACLFSFLAGTGKVYEIEKFTCYWTALNAHYNYLMACCKQRLADKNGVAKYDDLPKSKKISGSDAVCIGALMRVLDRGEAMSSQADRKNTFRTQYGATKSLLRFYNREELHALYEQLLEHRTDRHWVPDGPLGEHLKDCLVRPRRENFSAWGFLLLDYAYYMRCNYLHGDKTTILFSAANDPELAAFRALNVFLGEYLKEAIPQMFREGWFTEEMFEDVMRGIR